jgi:ribonuclease D
MSAETAFWSPATPLILVESREALVEAVALLRNAPAIGIDTEADSFHHYREKLCLVQISDMHQDFIIDPLAFDDLSPLAEILEDPSRVKVLHGGDYDVVSLKRDLGIRMRNIFDTMLAAQFMGMPRFGLADLVGRFFGVPLDKRFQRHDWAQRPLGIEHLNYARGDTHWLLALREVITHKLSQVSRLEALQEECRYLEEREWGGRVGSPADFLRVKGSAHLDEIGKKVLRAVWEYREACAEQMDRPAFKVMPDPFLLALAQEQPEHVGQLQHLIRRSSAIYRKHGEALLDAVYQGQNDDRPLPERERKSREERLPDSPGMDRVMTVLKNWRNEVVDQGGLNPMVVANNNLLKEIARLTPHTVDELAAVPGIRQWQLREYGPAILERVASVPPNSAAEGSGKRKRRRRRKKPASD